MSTNICVKVGTVISPVVIVDTGVLFALADKRDKHHVSCTRWLLTAPEQLLVPQPVLGEVCYLIGEHCGAEVEARFLESLGPAGRFTLLPLVPHDALRMAELVRQYRDLPLGGTDAAVLATAERLAVTTVATVDRRHFTIVRLARGLSMTIVP